MKQYDVTGMSCAACSNRIEKAVSKVPGVTSCSVSLLTNSMGVEGTASPEAVIAAVEKAGYGASEKGTHGNQPHGKGVSIASEEESLKDKETPKMKRRLIASLCFWIPLMYISMGHMMWNWPLPSALAENHMAIGLVELLLTTIIMVINQKFFVSGFTSLIHGGPNMDTLVALGAGASYGYSLYGLFTMSAALTRGDMAGAMSYMHDFYFESAGTILTLITIGKLLEAISKGRTTDALKGLMKLAPKTATIVRNGKEEVVSIDQVRKGDIFVVKPGENIPVDGVVVEGTSAVNESALTGESIPVDKNAGDAVSAATLNQSGYLRCQASRVGEDTTLSQIIQMVSDAAATKAPIAKIADKVSGIFVPAVIGIAVVTLIVWLLAGETIGFSLSRAISVLVISCPCALGLATPVAIMVGNGMGAKNGILFKTAVSLEETGRTQIVALDKTGTITSGEPKVTDMIPAEGVSEQELLSYAYALEQKSEHPLAHAVIVKAQESTSLPKYDADEFQAVPGNGLSGKVNGSMVRGGNMKFIVQNTEISEEIKKTADRLAEEGKTPLFFTRDGKLIGIIAVADVVKEDSPEAIKELRNMGIHVVMLTGDNERTAKAIDAADVVLMKSRLTDVAAAIRLSRATLRNIHENLFWAFIYNVIGIPLAAGVWYPLFGWLLNPMFGAAAMSLSSFCVVSNALRLNWFKMYDTSKDRKIKTKKNDKEDKTMTKTITIEGMMCGHCESTVKKALEALKGVENAEVSHTAGTAVVTLNADVSDDALKKAVEDQDYKVTKIA